MERLDTDERALRASIEEFLARASAAGGVAMGRGGMVVPWALHVQLSGPADARVEHRMELDGIDRATAQARQKTDDRARVSYVRRNYGADPALYHVVLDIDACVENAWAADLVPLEEYPPGAVHV